MCFFFQAEDGIRDVAVTGVQTCALPICECDCALIGPLPSIGLPSASTTRPSSASPTGTSRMRPVVLTVSPSDKRSEERRVGKSVDLGGRRIIKKKKKIK